MAAGGLGMAGGTAIITGGGALLGVAGSGSASMAAILLQTSSDYWIRQMTKLLVFCKCVLRDRLNDVKSIERLSTEIARTIDKMEQNIKELDNLKETKEKYGYLDEEDQRRYDELEALINAPVYEIPVEVYVKIDGREILLVNE